MAESRRASPFIDLASVEAWDAWFRWRARAAPRDVTIEDTWRRVATALVPVGVFHNVAQQRIRCMDALTSWRLLPDERLLAGAGTGQITWRNGPLHAVLNAAAFACPERVPGAATEYSAIADCAALAVRILDDAAVLAGMTASRLRIGIVGIADALALMGLGYDGDDGRAQAMSMARAITEGCLHANIQLAAERGPGDGAGLPSRAPPGAMRRGNC